MADAATATRTTKRSARRKRDPAAPKNISNPFSTGGGGTSFESRVQAAFVLLMLAGGGCPCLPLWPIESISLQTRRLGFHVDDLLVEVFDSPTARRARLLIQVKHDISITISSLVFAEVVNAAWNDFCGTSIQSLDEIAVVTGPLSSKDLEFRTLLEWARASASSKEYFDKVDLANFSSKTKIDKQKAFESHIKRANKGAAPDREKIWRFMKKLHILQFDLDVIHGLNLSLMNCVILQFDGQNKGLWPQIVTSVQLLNQNAGTIMLDTLPPELVDAFRPRPKVMFADTAIATASPISTSITQYPSELSVAQLIGSWNEKFAGDRRTVEQLSGEEYEPFIKKLRIELGRPNTPLRYRNGVWSIPKRLPAWTESGGLIFDDHIERLKEVAIAALASDVTENTGKK